MNFWLKSWSTATLLLLALASDGSVAQPFDNCAMDEYYTSLSSDITSWTKAQLSELLNSTHRAVLPVQEEGSDDVYKALIDLYPGDTPNETVQLAFQDISHKIYPYGNSQTWIRANLWPESRMTGDIIDDGKTDIHANVPADATVFASKENLFFGECGLFDKTEDCQPLPETNLTQTDGKIWQSPEAHRGMHARQILYMATRYYAANKSASLTLKDCPPFLSQNVYGYLSILLEWHNSYPVTDEEINRNDRICERWQGNRNPYIDYPDLVEQIFGQPDTIEKGTYAYSKCFNTEGKVATSSPTATPNACQSLEPGDLQIILSNADDPDQLAFFTLDNIPSAVGTIYVTDRPWDGDNLLDNGEGTIEFQVPASTQNALGNMCDGFCPGSLFGYNFGDNRVVWANDTTDSEGFDLGLTGDTILTYCLTADGDPHFLHGFSFAPNGTWARPGLSADEYGTETSALPEELLVVGSVAVTYHQNNIYNGTTSLGKDGMLKAMADPSNYEGSNEVKFDIQELEPPSGTAASGAPGVFHNTICSLGPLTTTLLVALAGAAWISN